MSKLMRIGSLPLALLLITCLTASESLAQRGRPMSGGSSIGRGGGSSISRGSSFSRGSSISRGSSFGSRSPSFGSRTGGPSSFHAGPNPGVARSYSSSRYRGGSGSGYGGGSSHHHGSHHHGGGYRPSGGVSISIGGRYPSYGYGFGSSRYPYYGGYSSGFGYSSFSSPGLYYSSRPSFSLGIYSSPSIYGMDYVDPYPPVSSSYGYVQPAAPYTTYREPTYVPPVETYHPQNNPYVSSAPQPTTGDPSDPNTQLRPGMLLPDGSRVISVGPLPKAGAPEAGAINTAPNQVAPTTPAPATTPAPKSTPTPKSTPAPAPVADPVPNDKPSEGKIEILPPGTASKSEDV